MTAKAIGVEKRRGQTVLLEPLAVAAQQGRLARELERQRLVILRAFRHELGKADRVIEACRHAPGKGFSD